MVGDQHKYIINFYSEGYSFECEELSWIAGLAQRNWTSYKSIWINNQISEIRELRINIPNPTFCSFSSVEYCWRSSPTTYWRIPPISLRGFGIISRIGYPNRNCQTSQLSIWWWLAFVPKSNHRTTKNVARLNKQTSKEVKLMYLYSSHWTLSTDHK